MQPKNQARLAPKQIFWDLNVVAPTYAGWINQGKLKFFQ